MKGLNQLISEKEKELRSLEDSLGFPIIEQAKTTRIRYLKAELEDLRALEEQIHLNDNQKIVFEWLKSTWKSHRRHGWSFPFSLVKDAVTEMPADIYDFYDDFTEREEFELLIAFGFWGLEQEETE